MRDQDACVRRLIAQYIGGDGTAIGIHALKALKVTHRAALAELGALFALLQQRVFSGGVVGLAVLPQKSTISRGENGRCIKNPLFLP